MAAMVDLGRADGDKLSPDKFPLIATDMSSVKALKNTNFSRDSLGILLMYSKFLFVLQKW